MASLFTEDFIRAVERLRIRTSQVPAGGRHAEHRSRSLGAGMEFRDFRSYVPGDDTRRVDWNLYRRSGRLFLRLFEEPEDLAVYVLVDVSDSMFFESPPRADAARQMAGVFTSIGLSQFDRVGIYPCGSELGAPLQPISGRQNLRRGLEFLDRLQPAGPTDLARCVARFSALRQRPGLAVIVSDFFDPHGIEHVIDAMRSLRHRLVLVQLVRRADGDPPMDGEYRMIDCESNGVVDVAVTQRVRERYRQAYETFNEALRAFVMRRSAGHLLLDADRPVLEQIGSLFADGVLVA